MTTPLLAEFPELSHLSRKDLEDLLTDPLYFQAVFYSTEQAKQFLQAHEGASRENESIARRTLGLQDPCYQLRSETKDAFDEAKRLEARWKELEREQKEIYQRFSPQFLLMRLRHAATAQDDASEALASSFIQSQTQLDPSATNANANGREVDEFVNEFKALRKAYHKRVMWGDKWASGQVTWRDD